MIYAIICVSCFFCSAALLAVGVSSVLSWRRHRVCDDLMIGLISIFAGVAASAITIRLAVGIISL